MFKTIILMLVFNLFTINVQAKAIYSGDSNLNHIYLTFDDGNSAKNTESILDILKAKDVPATFFIEGDFLVNNPSIIKRIVAEQTLGNHTMVHKDITKMTDLKLREDIAEFEKNVLNITNQKNAKYFRPPMGKINAAKLKIMHELGYKVIMWNVSYYDYVYYDDQGVKFVLDNILKQTKNGSIILMHTMTKSNVSALPEIIDNLRSKGFIFSDLNEL